MDTPSPVILTTCTNRKRIAPSADLKAASLPKGPLSMVASCWLARLQSALPRVRADRLYAGRAFNEARAAAGNADLYVVSAGLGALHAGTTIPSYSLTVAPGSSDDVLGMVSEVATASDWWQAGPANSPFHTGLDDIARRHEGQLILAALPSTYLCMLADDLERVLGQVGEDHLRLFCAAPPADLSHRLGAVVMPYDTRFDGPDSPLPGTQSDFAQRAMRHFAHTVLPHGPDATAKTHHAAVEDALAGFRPRTSVARDRTNDAEIVTLVIQNWEAADGRSGRMLRLLRDELGVACEQRRFARLFQAAVEQHRTEALA